MFERDSDHSPPKQLEVDDLEDDTSVLFYDPVFDLKIKVNGESIKRAQEVLEKHQKKIVLTMFAEGDIMAVIGLSQLVRQVEKKE